MWPKAVPAAGTPTAATDSAAASYVGAAGAAALSNTSIIADVAIGGFAGFGGSGGQGIGGGLYVATGGSVTLEKSLVIGNWASTSHNNIYGIVSSS